MDMDTLLVDTLLVDKDTPPSDTRLVDTRLVGNRLVGNQLVGNRLADSELRRKAEGLSGLLSDIQGKQDSDTHLEPLVIHKPMASSADHSAVESVFRFPHTSVDKPARPSAKRLE